MHQEWNKTAENSSVSRRGKRGKNMFSYFTLAWLPAHWPSKVQLSHTPQKHSAKKNYEQNVVRSSGLLLQPMGPSRTLANNQCANAYHMIRRFARPNMELSSNRDSGSVTLLSVAQFWQRRQKDIGCRPTNLNAHFLISLYSRCTWNEPLREPWTAEQMVYIEMWFLSMICVYHLDWFYDTLGLGCSATPLCVYLACQERTG